MEVPVGARDDSGGSEWTASSRDSGPAPSGTTCVGPPRRADVWCGVARPNYARDTDSPEEDSDGMSFETPRSTESLDTGLARSGAAAWRAISVSSRSRLASH